MTFLTNVKVKELKSGGYSSRAQLLPLTTHSLDRLFKHGIHCVPATVFDYGLTSHGYGQLEEMLSTNDVINRTYNLDTIF